MKFSGEQMRHMCETLPSWFCVWVGYLTSSVTIQNVAALLSIAYTLTQLTRAFWRKKGG